MAKEPVPASRKRSQVSILLGFAFKERGPSGKWRIRFRWGRVFGVLAGLAIVGYCSLATALYFYFKNVQNFEDVRYADMYVILFQREAHRARMGDFQIEQAKDHMREGEFRQAIHALRTGVIRAPHNLEGRLLLSEFFIFGMRRPEAAIQTLREGLPWAYDDSEYLKRYVQVLLRYQHDQEVIDVADQILAADTTEDIQRLLALAAATAHQYRGNFDEAENYIRNYDLTDSLEGTILAARVSWERGQRQAGIARLEQSLGKFRHDEPIYAMLSRFYREMGDYSEARRYAVLRNINSPLSVAPRIDLLYILRDTGYQERANRDAEAILRQFGSDEQGLLSLANYATDSANMDLARQIYERALENDFEIGPFALLLIEAHISSGDYSGAVAFTEELAKERPPWLQRHEGVFNSLRAVAYYGAGNEDLSSIYLQQFLQEGHMRVESLLAISRRFEQLGGQREARQILLQAYRRNPQNQSALSRLIALEIEMGNAVELGDYLKALLRMRRPSHELLEKAYRELGSDRFLFTRDRDNLLLELNSILYADQQVG